MSQSSAQSEPNDPMPTLVNSIGMTLVRVRAGDFVMGTPRFEKGRRAHEGPTHPVHISRPLLVAATPVTQDQFTQVMGTNPSFFQDVAGYDTKRFPVEQVVYDDAIAFCDTLSRRADEQNEGRNYRLPTEAEWEYACRAGTSTPFAFGDSITSAQANFDGAHPYGGAARGPCLERTTTVGSYPPNAFGLYDMHGNVYEWVSDFHAPDYYSRSPAKDPPGPATGTHRVLRGGSWRNIGSFLRSGERYYDRPDRRHVDHGFRVVCDVGS